MPASADGGNWVVGLGIAGGLGYLLYRYLSTPAAPAPGALPAVSPGLAAAAPGSAPAAGPAPGAPAPAYNSLDQIFQRLQASLAAANVPQVRGQYVQTPQQFSAFLARVSNVDVGGADLWPGIDAANPLQITLAQFWGVAAPWLAKNKGFSGLGGLGFYGLMFRRARPI